MENEPISDEKFEELRDLICGFTNCHGQLEDVGGELKGILLLDFSTDLLIEMSNF